MARFLKMIIIAVVLFSSCSTKNKKPNIILIMADDQGWYDVGFNGNTEIRTPHLDSLATRGVIFNRFYSASAVCSPTRASVITGRNPLRMDIPYANSGHMRAREITISEILQDEGYATGHFGKWHLGTFTTSDLDANRGGRERFHKDYSIPSEHGYDAFFCTESKVPTYDPMIYPNRFDEGESKRYGWKAISNQDSSINYGTAYWKAKDQKATLNLNGENSKIIMDRVIPFIEKSLEDQRPFFSTLWFHTPHLPVVSDSIHRSIYSHLNLDQQLYYGAITAMDDQVGRLWKQLELKGIEDETILFFCSDNGPENRTPGSAGIYRERKRSLYEGGVRVPAFVIWKDNITGNRRIDYPAVTSDYLPTLLDILDIDFPDKRPKDGTSILKAIQGEDKQREKPIGFICDPQVSWVTQQYKLIGDIEMKRFELYDLLNDPSENKNIISENPALAEKMKSDLQEWMQSVEKSKKLLD